MESNAHGLNLRLPALSRLLATWALTVPAAEATLNWGGGSANLPDGTPLNPLPGLWTPGTLDNWSRDAGPAYDYAPWANGDTGVFGATDAGYTVDVTAVVAAGGITTKVFSGVGSGPVVVRGDDAVASSFTINTGSTLDITTGAELRILSNPTNALTIITSGFIKTGAGTLTFDSTGVGNSNTAGTIDVQNGVLRVLGDRVGVLSNESLSLTGAAAVFEAGQGSSAISGISGTQFAGISGVAGSVIRSTGAGTHYIAWNSTVSGNTGSALFTDGGSGSRLGFVKAGSGTLTLSTANTYTGQTVVSGGRLIATPGAVTGALGISGGTFEAAVSGLQPGISVDGGRLLASAAINPSAVSVLGGAAVEFAGAAGIAGSGRNVQVAPGASIVSTAALDNAFLNRIGESFRGTVALGSNSAGALDFSSAAGGNLPNARLGVWGGSFTYSGVVTPAGDTYRLGGTNAAANTLTLDQTNALTGSRNLDVSSGFTGSRAANPAVSSVILTGSNDLNGSLTIGRYGRLELTGSGGGLPSVSAVNINGGTLALRDDALLGGNADRLPAAAAITFNQGGGLTFLGTRPNIEEAGQLVLTSGEANVSASGTSLGSSGSALFRFASLGSRGATATAAFANGTSNALRFAAAPANTNGILGGWTVTGGSNFTTINVNGQPSQVTPTTVTTDANWATVAGTGNYTIDAAFTATTAGNRSVNSLRSSFGSSFTVDLGAASNVVTLGSGGLLLSGANPGTLQGGTLTAGAGGAYHLFAHATNANAANAKTIAAPIADNGANPVTLVKAGAGTLILTGTSTHTGGTVINNGNLQVASAANVAVLGSGVVTFDGVDTVLSIGNTVLKTRTFANEFRVNADAIYSVPAGQGITSNLNGNVVLGNDATFTIQGNTNVLSGAVTGSGSLRFTQGASHTLGGSTANTYSGSTVVTAGTLSLNKPAGITAIPGDLYLGDSDASFGQEIVSLAQNHQIADSSIVRLSGGIDANAGILRLNGDRLETIGGLSSAKGHGIIENGGGAATSSVLTVDSSTSTSFGGLLRNNAAGDADRQLSLVKQGPGELELNGEGIYTGTTAINGGTLRINGSLTNSAVTVNSGGTLAGSGSIVTTNQAITFNAGVRLAPGNSIGTLTLDTGSASADLTGAIAATGSLSLAFELSSPIASDLVTLSGGALNIGAGLLEFDDFDFTLLGGFELGTYTLFSTPSSIGGTLGSNVSGQLGGYTASLGLADGNTDIVLNVVPEPGSAALCVAAVGLLARRRRINLR